MGSQKALELLSKKSSILFELSRVDEIIGAGAPLSESLKRVAGILTKIRSSLKNQSQINLQTNLQTNFEKFLSLRDSFFSQLKIKTVEHISKVEELSLNTGLTKSQAPRDLLLLIFLGINQSLDLKICLIECQGHTFIKVLKDGRPVLFDFDQHCKQLNENDILLLVNKGLDLTAQSSVDIIMSRHLRLIKNFALKSRKLSLLYGIQSLLFRWQPFILDHLLDRARVSLLIGNLQKAKNDEQQYLTYCQNKDSKKYKKLKAKLNRTRDENPLGNVTL